MGGALYLVIVRKAGGEEPGRTLALVQSITKDARGGLCLRAGGRTLRYFYPGTFEGYSLQGPYSDEAELMADPDVEQRIKERVLRFQG